MKPKLKSPEEVARLFVENWNERNARGIADLFTEKAEFVNVVGLWWHDREAIFRAHDYGLKRIFNHSLLELRKHKLNWLSDDIAIVHVRMKLSNQTKLEGSGKPESRQTIFSFVMKNIEGEWWCVSAHNTDIVPGSETNLIIDGELKSVSYR